MTEEKEKDSGSFNFTPPSADLTIDPLLPIVRVVLPDHLAYLVQGVDAFQKERRLEKDHQILYRLLLEIPRLPDEVRRALHHAVGESPRDLAHSRQELERQLLRRAIDERQRKLGGGRGSRTQAIADTAVDYGTTAQALKRRLYKRPRRRELENDKHS
jgi:hypothetical protein